MLSVVLFHQGIFQVKSLLLCPWRSIHPADGWSTKSKATWMNSNSICVWLSSFRHLSISLSSGALPTEPVPLSAPGGPPERSALSASVQQGAVPRTPCSPIPGVGRCLYAYWHKSFYVWMEKEISAVPGFCYVSLCFATHMYLFGHHLCVHIILSLAQARIAERSKSQWSEM